MKTRDVVLLLIVSTALIACQTPEPAAPTPVRPVFVAPPQPLSRFPNFPANFDFFAELPTTFPESANYRLRGIDLSGVADSNVAVTVRFSYDPQGRLSHKDFFDNRVGRNWRHNFTFDAQNRLLREESATFERLNTGEYSPVRIDYVYEADKLTKITKNTLEAGNLDNPVPNLVTRYRYVGDRQTDAILLNYRNATAVANLPYPMDSTRRRFIYTDNDRTITEQDSVWAVPCYPNMPCTNKFRQVDQTQKQVDSKGNLLAISTSVFAPLYPSGATTFTNTYDGPDGLLSRRINTSAGLVYRFLYQEK